MQDFYFDLCHYAIFQFVSCPDREHVSVFRSGHAASRKFCLFNEVAYTVLFEWQEDVTVDHKCQSGVEQFKYYIENQAINCELNVSQDATRNLDASVTYIK